ncbi:Gfo/Idh/MocA family oxidoreductase [Herbidospora mongoliensis]|uniref:Gfo/Idh/MocA family oxidoreductase n=1 Tax=Herbidospora mongoliensis TaxID=688067 RepID=UPI000833E007|nr:Gfo/Idh/MocA family oxidoreductase [Herbidospora mongoliensis]
MADDVRVGLVGYGPAGEFFHAPLITATPGLRLTAVVTGDPAKAARIGPGVVVVRHAADLHSLVDLVVVASPNRTHVPIASEALRAGLPVVVDKPLAATAEEALELAALARERGLLLTVFQNRRWDGDFLTIAKLRPRLGEIRRFESRFERWRPVPKGGWREQGGPEDLAGLLYDLGSHLVDQALQLLGPVTSVYAEADTRRAGVRADDDSFIALTHVGGARSHLWVSAVAAELGPRFRVLGSENAYTKWGMDPQEDRLRAGRSPAEPGFGEGDFGFLREERVPTEPGNYLAFYEGVVAALRGEGPAPVTPESAAETLTVLRAARVSADERRVITLS